MTAYFISGLGADRRVFKKLSLPPALRVVHLDWMAPLKGEHLPDYCKRMAAAINTSEPFILVGLSFGGMVAVELSKIVAPRHIVLISSAATRTELPPLFRFAGATGLYRLFPAFLFKIPNPLTYWVFGTDTKEEKSLLRRIMQDTSPQFLGWAISAILTWKNTQRPQSLWHLHGGKDRILPARYTHADVVLQNAGHFMVWDRAREVSAILTKHLVPYL